MREKKANRKRCNVARVESSSSNSSVKQLSFVFQTHPKLGTQCHCHHLSLSLLACVFSCGQLCVRERGGGNACDRTENPWFGCIFRDVASETGRSSVEKKSSSLLSINKPPIKYPDSFKCQCVSIDPCFKRERERERGDAIAQTPVVDCAATGGNSKLSFADWSIKFLFANTGMFFSFLTSPTSLRNLVLSLLTSTGGIFFPGFLHFYALPPPYYVLGRNLYVFFLRLALQWSCLRRICIAYIYIYICLNLISKYSLCY